MSNMIKVFILCSIFLLVSCIEPDYDQNNVKNVGTINHVDYVDNHTIIKVYPPFSGTPKMYVISGIISVPLGWAYVQVREDGEYLFWQDSEYTSSEYCYKIIK